MQGDREGVVAVERPASPRIDPVVFWTAAVLSAVFVAWGILFTDNLAAVFNAVLFNFLVPNFGWVFILATFGFLVFSLYLDRKSTRLNSSHANISYAVFCLKKKKSSLTHHPRNILYLSQYVN